MLKVICNGTKVKIANGAIDGIVTGISIRGKSTVAYEVTWFSGNENKTAYFYEFEVTVDSTTEKQSIGFVCEVAK